ncbi:hypothetical protein ACLOJK_014618 [Asimina triloba]
MGSDRLWVVGPLAGRVPSRSLQPATVAPPAAVPAVGRYTLRAGSRCYGRGNDFHCWKKQAGQPLMLLIDDEEEAEEDALRIVLTVGSEEDGGLAVGSEMGKFSPSFCTALISRSELAGGAPNRATIASFH